MLILHQKQIAYFVLYLKTIHTIMKNKIYILIYIL